MTGRDQENAEVMNMIDTDERMTTRQVAQALGYKSTRTVYRLADPTDPRWEGHPPLSPGVRRRGGRDLWFLRREVDEYLHTSTPRTKRRGGKQETRGTFVRDTGT